MRWILLVALAAASALVPARAFTPESGVWWNPGESGTGLQIEIQDNLVTVFVYAYDEDGFPMWYTSAGFLDDSATVYQGSLEEFFGGPCVGCPWINNTHVGTAGSIRIVFDPLDPTRATMTWGLAGGSQRTVQIERYHFYLHRGEDGGAPVEITKMIGEWTMVVDVFDDQNVQYYGDVHVYDLFEFDTQSQSWVFEGCRPETSLDNLCTDAAFDAHPVAGVYRPQDNSFRIVVVDYFDADANSDVCAVYDVIVGTNHFDGGQDGDLEPNDGGVAYYYCPQPANSTVPYNGNYDFYPIEGFRTASRTQVEEGTGPAKAGKPAQTGARSRGPAVSERQGKALGTPSAEDAALLRRLEQRIRDRQQSR